MNVQNTILLILIVIVVIICMSILYGSCIVYEKFETSSLFQEAPDPDTTTPIINTAKKTEESLPDPVKVDDEIITTEPITESFNDNTSVVEPVLYEPKASIKAKRASPSYSNDEEERPLLPVSSNKESMNSREKELFDQIIKDNMSGEELEKLIRAGAVTEKMVEKFLNELDKENSGDPIEAFCSGAECYSSF